MPSPTEMGSLSDEQIHELERTAAQHPNELWRYDLLAEAYTQRADTSDDPQLAVRDLRAAEYLYTLRARLESTRPASGSPSPVSRDEHRSKRQRLGLEPLLLGAPKAPRLRWKRPLFLFGVLVCVSAFWAAQSASERGAQKAALSGMLGQGKAVLRAAYDGAFGDDGPEIGTDLRQGLDGLMKDSVDAATESLGGLGVRAQEVIESPRLPLEPSVRSTEDAGWSKALKGRPPM